MLLSLAECRLMVKAWVARKAECQGPAMVRQPQVKASVTRKAECQGPAMVRQPPRVRRRQHL